MADYLSAGVYVEEVQTAAQIVPGVTTSNMGIVGYAARGPANVATLVQSYEQYTATFGGLVAESRMPLSMAAFFANGGRRAYVVRVPPADAVAADAKIQSVTSNELLAEGTGSLNPVAGTIATESGAAPIVPGSVTVNWRRAGVALLAQNAKKRDDTTNLTLVNGQTSYEGRLSSGTLPAFDARLDSVVRGTVTLKFTLAGPPGAVAIVVPVGTSSIVNASVGTATDGAVAQLDHRSGIFSIRTYGTYVPAAGDAGAAVTADYTPALATSVAVDARGFIKVVAGATIADGNNIVITTNNGTSTVKTFEFDLNGAATNIAIPFTLADSAQTVRDSVIAAINAQSDMTVQAEAVSGFSDLIRLLPSSSTDVGTIVLSTTSPCTVGPTVATNVGTWTGDVNAGGTNTINYSSGAYSISVTGFLAHNKSPIIGTYTRNVWDLNPISVGAWGNDLKIQMAGSPNHFTASTGTYSRFDLNVLLLNAQTGNYDVVEQYEELVFDDPTSTVYFADVVNELSDYISVTEPAGDAAPGQLQAVPFSQVIGGGNLLAASQAFSVTLGNAPIAPRTVTITYIDSTGATKTITDNPGGNGILTGAVSGTTNTVNYTTGLVEFTTLSTIKGGTLVSVSYRTAAAETVHTEIFGDAAKNYTAGAEGTFDGTNWGRDQFTNAATLAASNGGMYAFNRVEELLQVVIPDYAGNTLIAGDQLDYAATRAASPSGGDRFIILTTPSGYSAQEAVDWFRFSLGRYSDYAALYWPWVRVADPLQNNRPVLFPPLAHVAGVYARTDSTKNVGKSPGGTVDGALNYLTGLETVTTLADRDIVYPNKINPLISSTATGLAVWGVRTISNTPDWRYINARRLFMFLEKSVYNSTWWTVFENNGPVLWSKVSSQIGSFLSNLFSNGYFAGTSPSESYFVVCDASNNTAATIEAGQVVIDIGVAPNKPAEFVRLRFQQKSLNS